MLVSALEEEKHMAHLTAGIGGGMGFGLCPCNSMGI